MASKKIVLAEYFTTDDVTLLFGVRADWEESEVVEIKRVLGKIHRYVGVAWVRYTHSLVAGVECRSLPNE